MIFLQLISSAFDADSEESKSEDEEPMDEDEKSSELRQLAKSDAIELVASTEMLRIRFPFQSISIRLADFFCLQEKKPTYYIPCVMFTIFLQVYCLMNI
uniref:Uncharacterized protein n=1 Tax=Heterorhabditis bacteriophora TaxID=37862 RepID=A0A1I7WY53_HETBA